MAEYDDEHIRRLMHQARLKNAQGMLDADKDSPLRRIERLSKIEYGKGYDYAQAYAKGREHGEAAKLMTTAWKNSKVREILQAMPKKKREYVGIKNKALVPKRGQKAGPLKD